jgi:AAA family ATP:ADP antiporter
MGTRPLIIFHSFADMWTPIVLIILFWQFANSIYTVEQAKRIYPYLFFLSGISIIIPGIFMSFVKFDTTISIYAVVILGVFAIAVYYHINRNIEKKNNPKPEILLGKQQQNSIFQNIKNIATSPYLWLMIIILTTNDLENKEINLIFKNAIKNLYMDQSAYNEFMSYSNLLIGGCSISLFLPLMNIYRMAKWKTITRVGSIFVLIFIPILFACIWLGQNPSAHGIVGYTPTEILVYMTLILKILLVATSGFFFINLQIAFIPLAPTDKQNGQVFVQMLSNLFLFLISVFFVYLNQNHINKNFFTSENSLIFLTILALLSIFAISRLSKRFEQSKKFS